MKCHVCQKDKETSNGCVYSTGKSKMWSCNGCIDAMDRVAELEDVIRKVRDRLQQLKGDLSDEPWMTRIANKAFQPTFGGLREVVLDLDMALWRETS